MITGKSLLNYNNLFSPNEYKYNDKISCNKMLFKKKYGRRKHISRLWFKETDKTRN